MTMSCHSWSKSNFHSCQSPVVVQQYIYVVSLEYFPRNLTKHIFFHLLFFQKSTSVVADGLEEKLKKLEQTRDYLTASAGADNVDISNRSAVNIG